MRWYLALGTVLLGLFYVGNDQEGQGAPAPASGYVGSRSCSECHARAYETWQGSHHDLAMQEATAETVLGDFGDAVFEHQGVTTRFFRRDGGFFASTEGPDGAPEEFEVAYVFGVEPLQQYLFEFPGGRLQCLTVAWDTFEKRWFHLYPDDRFETDDPLHWTGRYQNWNMMCAECHSTGLRKGYDVESDTYHTTWEEIDVSCEACHGPGAQHVHWAEELEKSGVTVQPAELAPEEMGLSVRLRRGELEEQLNACGPCHSRRSLLTDEPAAGLPFLDHNRPQLLVEGMYHADGQILEEVYVYGSFVQSKMYQQGVACTECHEPHDLSFYKEGNALCTMCHTIYAPIERFPTLVEKEYDTPEHHFHEVGTEGAECIACHMPVRTYMQVDPRHDHSFRVPRPDLTVRLGTPNACNDCHVEESAKWAVDAVNDWYGPETGQKKHFAESFTQARRGDPDSLRGLSTIALDVEQPPIVRATALALLEGFGPAALEVFAKAARDPSPLVRSSAIRALGTTPLEARLAVASPALADSNRAVRTEAARVLVRVPRQALEEEKLAELDSALDEFRAVLEVSADMPATHMNIGRLHQDLGQPELAAVSYYKTLELDPFFLPVRFNLSALLNAAGRNAEAERVLRGGIERFPKEGELFYSLGLLLAEEQRFEESSDALTRAGGLLPDRPRVQYNRGLALQRVGRVAEAETALMHAHELAPRQPEYLNALTILYAQTERWDLAVSHAEELVSLLPNDPNARGLLAGIRQARDSR